MTTPTQENKKQKTKKELKESVILFAGDSGDGIQLTGTQFTNTNALFGNDISTFPNYPAEIRAPAGTLAGVSGFQLNFGSVNIHTAGDHCDVLVVMNAAALKASLHSLTPNGTIIANTSGFEPKNLDLAKYPKGVNPLKDGSLDNYSVHEIDITKLTRACLDGSGLGVKEIDRSKNMFVLGFILWMYNRSMEPSISFLKEQFKKKPELIDTNIKVLKAGYNYGDTTETFTTRYEVKAAPMPKGIYRSIMGNQATAIGLIAAAKKSGLTLFYGTYPITPASDILHELAKHKNFGVKTFQAEDEIAAVCSAIGASFGGSLGVTGSSGPGIALKGEAIGLAVMLELPLVIINVQRGGPSTGLPTKTEQADLLQAMYGRNGECPLVVVAASSPSDCFNMAFEACRISLEHMVPVMLLTDGYIANGSEPWRFPKSSELADIKVNFATKKNSAKLNGAETIEKYLPYLRDEKLSRPWAIPGTKGLEHRVGGIEKEHETGNISYEPDNHEFMVKMRQAKVDKVADYIPEQKIDSGPAPMGKEKGRILVLGWGSTYGSIKTAVKDCIASGIDVSHAQVKYMNPLPKNLGSMLKNFDKVLVPEINNGQFSKIIRDKFLIDAIPFNKIKGNPFTSGELKKKIEELNK
ncbi:MAG TPA: 2-oxoacid:acceptor oxidoreductase subunit alpha [Chitinophagaceae bacterium]|nr:2-oxoacid:acceptor oxidoreductase subunit alpha [Chitinophagaceae bacterium]